MRLKYLKQIPYQIAEHLAANSKIVNLIYNDNPSVLTDGDVVKSMQELIQENYIGFYPATETGISTINRNTFIVINCEDFNLKAQDNNVTVTGSIYVTTDKAHALLDQGRLRLLELIDEIDSCLDNEKFIAAGKIQLTTVHYVVFSDFRSGYRIHFRINDQPIRKAEL